jgi:hypothetical protein
MSEPIKPALTAFAWDMNFRAQRQAGRSGALVDPGIHQSITGPPHEIAALALYGQPFGFTREDVELLRNIVRFVPDVPRRIHDLADRIAALLPPE